jgi:hypothetical protein
MNRARGVVVSDAPRFVVVVLIVSLVVLGVLHGGERKAKPVEDSQVHVAFIYQFLGYIHTASNAALSVASEKSCSIVVVGNDKVGARLKQIEGRKIPGGQQVIKILRQAQLPAEGPPEDCCIVYICNSEQGKVGDILAPCKGHGVLTVSCLQGFIEEGGMLRLLRVENRLRWEINLVALIKEGLQFDSQILRNAVRILRQE